MDLEWSYGEMQREVTRLRRSLAEARSLVGYLIERDHDGEVHVPSHDFERVLSALADATAAYDLTVTEDMPYHRFTIRSRRIE